MTKMNNFIWTKFGKLSGVHGEEQLHIVNENGEERIMSEKYRGMIPKVKSKAEQLIGKSVEFRTSQNTAEWSTNKYFSDIRESK